jgi:hypothetical protein
MSQCLGAKRRTKAAKGHYTTPNVWDEAAALALWRTDPLSGELVRLDSGVNYFVLMLNQLGLPTFFSCEGHPCGFYITFEGPYEAALAISQVGYFSIEIEKREDYWSMRQHLRRDIDPETGRKLSKREADESSVDGFRWAAKAWEEKLGPLDFEAAVLEG